MATEAKRASADASIDVVGEVCPMTYVRTKLALEPLAVGQRLEVRLAGEEPLRNVPRSAREEGHEVEWLTPAGDGTWRLLIRKGHDAF